MNNLGTVAQSNSSSNPPRILQTKVFKTCHIYLPDMPKPVGAIAYQGYFYSYVKFFPTLEAAQRAYERLVSRGNRAVLTQVAKGLVLWVLELDAKPASR